MSAAAQLVAAAANKDPAAAGEAAKAVAALAPDAAAAAAAEAVQRCDGDLATLLAMREPLAARSVVATHHAACLTVVEAIVTAWEERRDRTKAVDALLPFARPKAPDRDALPDQAVLRASVRLAEAYLAFDDFITAEGEVNALTRNNIRYAEDPMLRARHSCCVAGVQAHRGRLAEAAQRYYDFSFCDPAQAIVALENAAVCAVAAEPSELRSRVLAAVAADTRMRGVEAPLVAVVRKAAARRFLAPADAAELRARLTASQQDRPLARAVNAHNVTAAAAVYSTITLARLAALVGVTEAEAEAIAVALIGDGQLAATIDQCAGVVTVTASNGEAVARRDRSVAVVCAELAKACDVLTSVV